MISVCCNMKAMTEYVKPYSFYSVHLVIRYNSTLQTSVVCWMNCNFEPGKHLYEISYCSNISFMAFVLSFMSQHKNIGCWCCNKGRIWYIRTIIVILPQCHKLENSGGHFQNLTLSQAILFSAVCFNLPQGSRWKRKHCLSSLFS